MFLEDKLYKFWDETTFIFILLSHKRYPPRNFLFYLQQTDSIEAEIFIPNDIDSERNVTRKTIVDIFHLYPKINLT